LADSDSDINGADREDNVSLYSADDSVLSKSFTRDEDKEPELEFNFN
jgi:hypothetical protein